VRECAPGAPVELEAEAELDRGDQQPDEENTQGEPWYHVSGERRAEERRVREDGGDKEDLHG